MHQALLCVSDPKLRGLLALLVGDLGCQITTCNDMREAEEVLLSKPFVISIVTFNPQIDLSGYLRTARQFAPDTRIILLSAREDVESLPALFKIGLDELLLMPLNAKRTTAALQRLIQEPKSSSSPFPLTAGAGSEGHRAVHVAAKSKAMRSVVDRLVAAKEEPVGIVLRGEPGVEFELLAREYHSIAGGTNGQVTVVARHEASAEGLETLLSLHRLSEEVVCTLYLADPDKLPRSQQSELVSFLSEMRRRRVKDKPVRLVVSFSDAVSVGRDGVTAENAFLEELLFFLPTIIEVPPMRERREDIELMARKILLNLTSIYSETKVRAIDRSALDWLHSRFWLGNYVEFADMLARAIMSCPKRVLDVEAVSAAMPVVPAGKIITGPIISTSVRD